jgi:hypothetical protein
MGSRSPKRALLRFNANQPYTKLSASLHHLFSAARELWSFSHHPVKVQSLPPVALLQGAGGPLGSYSLPANAMAARCDAACLSPGPLKACPSRVGITAQLDGTRSIQRRSGSRPHSQRLLAWRRRQTGRSSDVGRSCIVRVGEWKGSCIGVGRSAATAWAIAWARLRCCSARQAMGAAWEEGTQHGPVPAVSQAGSELHHVAQCKVKRSGAATA